ncbi:MAG: Ppx/GppA family phosphatase [Alphaproteobacteria bacterium]|nr:Ppx/GppA family phosphatase [Alphaproteobacteria bacterium]MBU2083614.1 Ppx/GppA family phosphatase [Alphaproteobacteria bacterium]MBU2143259.1 Ppx/GppA family phosphatase [Alphaproteobacteria bacterium]MBU2195080.1 Ppx/GppA family phosphatase [Alphaproteobacteria bacterium]
MIFPKSERAGIIDIGSNSVRLVIYDVLGSSILQTFNEKVMAGLGEGLIKRGTLSPTGREAALGALNRYRAILKALNLRNYTAVATAAVREASDGPDFVKKAGRVLGRPVRVLSGADEARLSALGVEASFHQPSGVMGDLGGSSLEFQRIGYGKAMGESLLLGPLSLAEDVIDLRELRKKVKAELKKSKALPGAQGRFYAVGGAWRSFARLNMDIENYPLHVLQGYQMNEGQVARAAKLCFDSVTNPAARSIVEKVDRRRARHLPIAAMILEEVLASSQLAGVTISSGGLREGVLRDMTGAAVTDPLLDGVIAFGRLDHNQIAFGQALHEFVSPAFGPEADLFGSPAADARIEKAACMMADSAGRFHPDHRSLLAYEQALRAPYAGVSHAERAMIAYAIGCRYEKDFKRPSDYLDLTTDEQADRAKQLGSAMRLGAVFSGRSGPILQRASLARQGGDLELHVLKVDAPMVSDTVVRRLAQTANQLRLKPKVVTV